jgi:hypothetical protein
MRESFVNNYIYIDFFFVDIKMRASILFTLGLFNFALGADHTINEQITTFFNVTAGDTYIWQNRPETTYSPGRITSNFFLTHNGFNDDCTKVSATTNLQSTPGTSITVSDITVHERDTINEFVTCRFVLDYLYDTDQAVDLGTDLKITFDPASTTNYTIHYVRDSIPAKIRTAATEEQYIMKNVTLVFDGPTKEFVLDTTIYRAALTNSSCAEPDEIEINVGTDTSGTCTFTSSFLLADTNANSESLIFRSTMTRNVLIQCSDGPPVANAANDQLTYTYTVYVNNNKAATTYSLVSMIDGGSPNQSAGPLEAWTNNDPECNALRDFVATDRNSHEVHVLVDTNPITLTGSQNLETSMFYYVANSLAMDTTICDGKYASHVSALTFEMYLQFPSGSTFSSSDIDFYGSIETLTTDLKIGNYLPVVADSTVSCTAAGCTVRFRTTDCLPVTMITGSTCSFESDDLFQNIYARRNYTLSGASSPIVDFTGAINSVLPVSTFVSSTCPTLTSVIDVSDSFPSKLVIRTDGGLADEMTVVAELVNMTDNDAVSIEILDVTVSLYQTDNTLFGRQIFSKDNKISGMYITSTSYYNDAHYCRYHSDSPTDYVCTAFYRYGSTRARNSLLDANGLYPACTAEKSYQSTNNANTNTRNFDVFAFTPNNWLFKDFNNVTGYVNIDVVAAIRGCHLTDEAYDFNVNNQATQAPTPSRRLLREVDEAPRELQAVPDTSTVIRVIRTSAEMIEIMGNNTDISNVSVNMDGHKTGKIPFAVWFPLVVVGDIILVVGVVMCVYKRREVHTAEKGSRVAVSSSSYN